MPSVAKSAVLESSVALAVAEIGFERGADCTVLNRMHRSLSSYTRKSLYHLKEQ